tara:strand:- start:526 stop:732 length:207 start_codon:yes stop_codon:yes gene_type:complete
MISPQRTNPEISDFSHVNYLIHPHPEQKKYKKLVLCMSIIGGAVLMGSWALFFTLGKNLSDCNNTLVE